MLLDLEADVLLDTDPGAVYLGELNPRISGVSSMTNVTAGAYADVPLFLFHLLEFMDVDYTVDAEEINERWLALAAVDVWSQLIMKEPGETVERILAAPPTGPGAWPTAASSPSSRSATTGTRSPPRTRPSSCGSTAQASTASTVPTWASSSPRAACRPLRDSPTGAAGTSRASAPSTSQSPPRASGRQAHRLR